MKATALWLAIIVAAVGSAGAATYYVDSEDGCDDPAWNGGPSDPWATLTYALSRANGENTFMCRGTFVEEVRVGEDDDSSGFVGNADAELTGAVVCENYCGAGLTSFRTYGFARGGAQAELAVNGCYFNYPVGRALIAGPRSGVLRADNCIFENCGYVLSQPFEFGMVRFSDCSISDCAEGISGYGEFSATVTGCTFYDVDGPGVYVSIYGDRGEVRSCEFYGCRTGVGLQGPGGPDYGCNLSVHDSIIRDNYLGIAAGCTPRPDRYIVVSGNDVTGNGGNGAEIWGEAKLRGNTIRGNGGHGVYIEEDEPDLGLPGDPGGNTFAGNGSGYDVYNNSPENIPAVGNSWDPQSEQEMSGKTWQQINVTRIYDRWDDPSVGYVMWSEPLLGVTPTSLGRIKASFGGAETPGHTAPGTAAEP